MNYLDRLFQQYFRLIPAITREQREAAFRLRYQVICEEMSMPGYEPWRYPKGLEVDEYDQRAVHTLLWHRPSDSLAGTVRLILPDPHNLDASFPIEDHATQAFWKDFRRPEGLQRQHTAEVSRYILAKRFRSRPGEHEHPYGTDALPDTAQDRRRRFPHPILGLQRALIQMSQEHQIHHWYAIMEPALNRLLRHFALDLDPVGDLIHYNGMRQPHWADLGPMLNRIHQEQPDIWAFVSAGGLYPAES